MEKEENKLTLKEKWNLEYNKKDLKPVLIKGLIAMFLATIAGASIDYLLFMINASFTVGMFVLAIIVGIIIQRTYGKYHIKYSFIAVLYVFIGMFLLNLFRLLLINQFRNLGDIFSNGSTYMLIFLYPIKVFVTAINIGNIANYVFSIIELAIYIGSFFVSFYLSKRNDSELSEEK